MTDWRTSPTRQVDRDRDNDEIEPKTKIQPVGLAGPELPADAKTPPRGIGAKLKQLFKDAMKALTGKAPAPEPKPRRKRTTDDTGRAFLRAARKFVGHIRRRPVIQSLGLHEPELWQWNNPDAMYQASEEFHYTETNHLSPHL
jgi:hypothetical protein